MRVLYKAHVYPPGSHSRERQHRLFGEARCLSENDVKEISSDTPHIKLTWGS